MLSIMYCPLCRPLFDGREVVIVDSELHKEGFMKFMDPDFGNPLCFCLPLGIKLIFFLSWHLMFFTPFIFIHSPMNFLFCILTQHWLVSLSKSGSSKSGSYPGNSLKYPAFNVASLYAKKTESFLLIFVVKEWGHLKDETVSGYTRNPNSLHVFSVLTYSCLFRFIVASKEPAFSQNFTEIIKDIFSTLEKTVSLTPILHANSWHLRLPRKTIQINWSCEQICVSFLHDIVLSFSRKTYHKANCLKTTENM